MLVLGVDRMDYTKGIPERLQSFRMLLEKYPELRRQVTLVQIVVPSRSDIPKYQDLRQQVELLVSEINGRFTAAGMGSDSLYTIAVCGGRICSATIAPPISHSSLH